MQRYPGELVSENNETAKPNRTRKSACSHIWLYMATHLIHILTLQPQDRFSAPPFQASLTNTAAAPIPVPIHIDVTKTCRSSPFLNKYTVSSTRETHLAMPSLQLVLRFSTGRPLRWSLGQIGRGMDWWALLSLFLLSFLGFFGWAWGFIC